MRMIHHTQATRAAAVGSATAARPGSWQQPPVDPTEGNAGAVTTAAVGRPLATGGRELLRPQWQEPLAAIRSGSTGRGSRRSRRRDPGAGGRSRQPSQRGAESWSPGRGWGGACTSGGGEHRQSRR